MQTEDGMSTKKLSRVDRLIRDAFADLLEQQEFAAIRVTDIIKHADVSRSAFYSHYVDKYDLIDQIEQELMQGFQRRMQQVQEDGSSYRYARTQDEITGALESEYFRFIKSESRWWTLFMTGRGRSDFVQRFTQLLYRQFNSTAERWKDPEDEAIPRMLGLVMGAWSYVGVISYWLETGMKETPEEMGRVLAIYWFRYKHWLLGES